MMRAFARSLAAAMLLAAGPLWAQAAVDGPRAVAWIRIAAALSAVGTGDRFPLDTQAQEIGLPDDWANSRPGSAGPVWYRVAFDVAEPAQRSGKDLLGVYIRRACTNLEVYLNGQLIHAGGRMSGHVTHNCNHPQLASLPAALLKSGHNTLDIKVVGMPATQVASRQRSGGMSAIEIGYYQALLPRASRDEALQVGLALGVSATLVITGSFMFVMGWRNRKRSHLAYFGALSIGWALMESRLWMRELPISGAAVEFLLAALIPFLTLAAVQFLLRYGGLRRRWIGAGLWAQCVLMPISLFVAGADHINLLTRFWTTLFAAEVIAAGVWYLRVQWAIHGRAFWLMAVLLAIVLAAVMIEFIGLRAPLPWFMGVLAQTVTPVVFVIVGLRLMQQHGKELQRSEADRASLEARIAEATAEIERNFKQLSQMRVEQVTERERKRIAADLHDDLGAKLLTIVHTSESERISTLAREALEEMRLSVRGLTGRAVVLDDAIADWRAEVVSRLGQAGIESDWSTPLEDLPQTLSARAYVQTTRIVRESVSNIIKHSGATRCTVSCAVAEGDFQIVIQDNGNGIPMELDGRLDRGHGMASMKARAKQLQGQCLVESGPGYGTVIRLTIPLDRAIEGADKAATAL